MKERPIIFSAPMVRAVLEDRKTQTRRIMKPQPCFIPGPVKPLDIVHEKITGWEWGWRASKHDRFRFNKKHDFQSPDRYNDFFKSFCPFGQPGDLLWLKESWQVWKEFDHLPPSEIPQDADILYLADRPNMPWDSRRRSPLHMPRHASRITLRITSVRVEPLQDMRLQDYEAEGIVPKDKNYSTDEAIKAFAELWESLHGPGSWDADPWVWVIEFERVEP